MKTIDVMVGDHAMRLHLSAAGGSLPLVFLNDNLESGEGVVALLDDLPLNIAVVDPGLWEDLLSPWPEPALCHGGNTFGGKGRELIRAYWKQIIPKAEQLTIIKPKSGSFPVIPWRDCGAFTPAWNRDFSREWRLPRPPCGMMALSII